MRLSLRGKKLATFCLVIFGLLTITLILSWARSIINDIEAETLRAGKDTNAQAATPNIKKHVTEQASFVLYIPEGWSCVESSQQGFRTVTVTDASGMYQVVMSYGRNPQGNDVIAAAGFFISQAAQRFPDLRLENSMVSQQKNRIVFDGFYTDIKKGKREFRCWVSGDAGNFICSKVEGPEAKLDMKKEMLLTILSNIRIMKDAFRYTSGAAMSVQLVPYRLGDGSARFKIPQGWRVQEFGQGQFVASDTGGTSSFMVASVDIITPALGVSYPGSIVLPFLSPHDALKALVTQQGIASDMQFQEVIPRQDLVQQISQVYTMGTVAVEDFIYTCTTRVGRVKGFTMGLCFYARLGVNWNFRHMTVAAPEQQFEAFIPTFTEMLQSYTIDEQWARDYVRRGMERLRQMQKQTSEMMARNAQEIHDMMQAAYEERQTSQDYIDYQRTNYIRGEQDWISSVEGGTIYHTDSWGTKNTATGEYWEGQPYDSVHFKGDNPKYKEQMTAIDSRELWEKYIRQK